MQVPNIRYYRAVTKLTGLEEKRKTIFAPETSSAPPIESVKQRNNIAI
jgi:hypothetical protein